MRDVVEFEGPRGKMAFGSDAAQIVVRSEERWVYIGERAGVAIVASGPPCRRCQRKGTRYLRCGGHAWCSSIAVQLDLL